MIIDPGTLASFLAAASTIGGALGAFLLKMYGSHQERQEAKRQQKRDDDEAEQKRKLEEEERETKRAERREERRKQKRQEAADERKIWQGLLDQYAEQIRRLTERVSILENQVHDLQAKLRASDFHNDQLRQENERLRSDLLAKETELSKATVERDKAIEKLAKLTKKGAK